MSTKLTVQVKRMIFDEFLCVVLKVYVCEQLMVAAFFVH